MRVLVLFYSGTGNTKFACDVARIAAEKAGHEVTMKTYTQAAGESLAGYDLYCFAAPVYEWAPARNVERFVDEMPALTCRPCFMVTTSAGATGQAIPLLARMLREKGLVVLGSHNLICPDSWGGTRRWSSSQDDRVPTAESVRDLALFTGQMLQKARSALEGEPVEVPSYRVRPTGLFLASRLSRLAPRAGVKMGRKKVDEQLCTECGVCEKNCPSGAITLGPYPIFDSSCIACWRCINTCPADCITTAIDSNRHYKGIPDRESLLRAAGLLGAAES